MGAGEIVGRWWRTTIFTVAAVAMTAVVVQDGHLVVGLLLGAVLLGVAVYLSPWRGGDPITHAEAQERARQDGSLVAYWRPGCVHCERLRSQLRGERGVVWVDIWQDPAAADFVREMNHGEELVPTVIAGTAVWPRPGAEKVRAALHGAGSVHGEMRAAHGGPHAA